MIDEGVYIKTQPLKANANIFDKYKQSWFLLTSNVVIFSVEACQSASISTLLLILHKQKIHL